MGVLLTLLDLRIERFDLLNDVVGVALVLVAIRRLAEVGDRVTRLEPLWWALLAVTAVEEALVWFGPVPAGSLFVETTSVPGTLLSIVGSVLTLLALLALAGRFAGLASAELAVTRSWETTHKLLFGLYAPLTGLLVLLGLVDLAVRLGDRSAGGLDIQLEGGAALALLPFVVAFLVPPAHLAISLWRTSRDAREPVLDPPSA